MSLKKFGGAIKKKKRDLFRWYLIIPCLAFILYFAIVPMVFLWGVSFSRYEIIMPDFPVKFVGFKNYIRVFTSAEFWRACEVTGWLTIVTPCIQLFLGLGLALLINQIDRGRKIITTILLIPMMVAPAAAAFNFRTMYNVHYGPLNYLLSFIGIPELQWTGSRTWALPSIMLADIWQWTPFMMILILAGRMSLPQQVYEASSLMSKSTWKTFIHITFPLLKPFIFLALILRFIDAFKYLDLIYILTGGGPGSSTENLAFLTYRKGLRSFNIGYAAAMSIVGLGIVILVCNLLLKPRTTKPRELT